MFSVRQKRAISDAVQNILRATNHPELPKGEIQFKLHVNGAENWSWADISNNAAVTQPTVNPWNEQQDQTNDQLEGLYTHDHQSPQPGKNYLVQTPELSFIATVIAISGKMKVSGSSLPMENQLFWRVDYHLAPETNPFFMLFDKEDDYSPLDDLMWTSIDKTPSRKRTRYADFVDQFTFPYPVILHTHEIAGHVDGYALVDKGYPILSSVENLPALMVCPMSKQRVIIPSQIYT